MREISVLISDDRRLICHLTSPLLHSYFSKKEHEQNQTTHGKAKKGIGLQPPPTPDHVHAALLNEPGPTILTTLSPQCWNSRYENASYGFPGMALNFQLRTKKFGDAMSGQRIIYAESPTLSQGLDGLGMKHHQCMSKGPPRIAENFRIPGYVHR